ncbi:HesA/MoeB/ThiF family protein [Sorangium sp. So ce1389]|uniref:HesA/MoeB/ThiF family protein n=1 Tax=Sorangium sp. So ce1389 TaxID=3133336 RepID=UPI003F5F9351
MECVFKIAGGVQIWPISLPKETNIVGVPASIAAEFKMSGRFLRLRESAPLTVPDQVSDFAAFIAEFAGEALAETSPSLILLVWPDGQSRCYWRGTDKCTAAIDIPVEREPGIRIPQQDKDIFEVRRVGLVGLGSLGSKTAESLARSGVRHFVFVDSDVLLGPNLCRHAARVRDIGTLKVHAVDELIRESSVDNLNIKCHTVRLADATNPEVHARVLEDLAQVDVIVDATADPEAFCVLAMLASDHRIPLIWGEVFGGGLGGFLASAHPNRTPCPHCVRAGFLAHLAGLPPAPLSEAVVPYGGSDTEPLVASDADVSYIAAAVAARALDFLMDATPQEAPVTLLGWRRGWVFERAFQSIPIDVRSDDWSCTLCWTPPEESDSADEATIEALFAATSYAKDPPVT